MIKYDRRDPFYVYTLICSQDDGDWTELCTSCTVESSPIQRYVGKMTLMRCKQTCITEHQCTAIDYGKGTRNQECFLKYGGKRSHSPFPTLDAHIVQGCFLRFLSV